MSKEINLEFKVGLFVVLAVGAFTVFVSTINETSSFGKGKSLKIIFDFANGLKKNAPVRIAGVDQGVVSDIRLFFDRQDSKTKAEVEIKISREAEIPVDSIVMINQLGLLGEKYIEIIPGVDTRSFFQEGQTAIGKNPIAQEIISDQVMAIAKKMDTTIASFNKIINDEKNQDSISATLQNLSSVTGGLNGIVSDMRASKGTIGRLLYDERLYDDLQGLTSELKQNPWKLLYRPK